ncbi:MAG: radical SAM protein [Labilithrix sp.]|nr:radical SAM protein [Labilithrix sp.]
MSGRPKVYSVAIEVTAHCQQKCAYCYNAWREDNGAGMEAGSAKKLHARVEKLLAAIDVDHVTITGGEPFARRDLFELLDLVDAKGAGIQIISNGGLVTDAIAARLAPYRVSYVQITLDGPTAELHDEHVGGDPSAPEGQRHFDRTLAGIAALQRAGVPVVGCTVVTRKNAARLGEILTLFQSIGVRHVALSRFSPAGYAARHAAELLPSRDDLLVAFRQAIPFAKGERGEPMRLTCTMPVPPCAVEVEELHPLEFGVCAIGTSAQEFALGPDGRLRHCTLHGAGLGGAKDILDDDVDPARIVTGAEVREYKRTLPEFCAGCSHASTCGGGCGAASEWVLGARTFPDPLVWQHVDDAFSAKLATEREASRARRRLEVIA